jgi:hypothetical protein
MIVVRKMNKGAHLDFTDKEGKTVLHHALMISLDQEHFMVSEMLIDRNPSHR